MKKRLTFIAIILLCLSVSVPSSGQKFLEKLTKKASEKIEQKAEERANEKIDEKIDEGFDKVLEGNQETDSTGKVLTSEEKQQRRMSNILGKMGVSSEPVNMADSYHFTFMLKMHFQTQNKNGKTTNEGEIVTYATPGEPNFAYEFLSGEPKNNNAPGTGLFLMDFTNNVTLILSDENGKKSGIAFGMGNLTDQETWKDLENEEEEVETAEIDYVHPNVKKTGRTKNILGYPCEEYEFSDEENLSQFWITKKIKGSSRDVYASIFQSSMFTGGLYNGFLMESNHKDLKTGEISTMQVTEINESTSQTFSVKEYEIMNLGSINMQTEEK